MDRQEHFELMKKTSSKLVYGMKQVTFENSHVAAQLLINFDKGAATALMEELKLQLMLEEK